MKVMADSAECSFTQWFRNLKDAVVSTFKGLMITIRYVYGVRPVTIEYPEVREVLPENSRSRLYNDAQNCISCLQCANACPVDCIYITATIRGKDEPKISTSGGTPIRQNLEQYTIDTALCCYCGLCTTVCPTHCLTHTTDYEYSQYTLADMKYDFLSDELRAWRDRLVK